MAFSDKQLIDHLIQAIKIPSPSGREERMASWIEEKLKNSGLQIWRDKVGSRNNSDSGNVYGFLEKDPKLPAVIFCAHMDTVEKGDKVINPLFDQRIFKSDGETILGADNKAGIIALLALVEEIDKRKLKNNLLFFFSTREEAGIMGSLFFEFPGKKIKYIFNVDSSDKPGVFIYRSLGYMNFGINVIGRAAHAAKEYEKGVNAIAVAAELITRLPLGKNNKEKWTLNIGKISGGESTNVVCDLVELKGEFRFFNQKRVKKIKLNLQKICKQVAKEFSAKIKVDFDEKSYIPPFKGKVSGKINKICEKACDEIGLNCEFKEAFSTSDANSFSGQGFEVVSVSRGANNAHSKSEEFSLADLKKTISLLKALVALS